LANLEASEGAKAIRVLHVDDDASLLEISKLMLLDLNSGFVIDQACCVDEALKKMVGVYGWTVTEEGESGKGVKFILRISGMDRHLKMKTN
jgi:hypothetical protein